MIDKLVSKISLNIKGKNINRFIKKLRTNKIEILSLKYIDKNIAFIIFLIFTHIIFNVEVIHSNKDIRNLILSELKKENIKPFSLKKSYSEISQIKENILNKYKDKIEWLEIEENGTKYTVRVEERTIVKKDNDNTPRNIIAKKDGVLKKVIAEKGDIVKDMNDYVKKGDLIVNGELIFNDEVKGKVKAEGKAFAEVWYVTKTEYPIFTFKETKTKNTKNVYAIKFLNHTLELTFNKFKTKQIEEKEILKHNLIPFKIVKQKQTETKVKDEILTVEEAIYKAKQKAENNIKKNLSKEEYIIRSKYLKSTVKESIVEVEMFFAVYENITDYAEIG